MTRNLRRLVSACVPALAAGTLLVSATAAQAAIAVEGEAATATNARTASDAEASGGKYLLVETSRTPPPRGWYASYTVKVKRAGSYRLDAVTSTPQGANSYYNVSIDGRPYRQVVRSFQYWSDFPSVWGDLFKVDVGDVYLHAGKNRIAFMVNERRIRPAPQIYRFELDRFELTPVPVAIAAVRVGAASRNLGTVHAGDDARVRYVLNGPATATQSIPYEVRDYTDEVVASGTATVPLGSRRAVAALSGLGPGWYRVSATLGEAADTAREGTFAVLPARRPVAPPLNRFGINTLATEMIGSSQLHPFGRAMHEMGAGYVREETIWPTIEPKKGEHDARLFDRIAKAFRQEGLRVLNYWGTNEGRQAPDWAMTDQSKPLPDDLRDAYVWSGRLADDGVASALEILNEPEQESFCCSTGDQIAAYSKAALLGISDAEDPPLGLLPAFWIGGPIQELMLQNEVVPYADAWSFHAYPFVVTEPGGLTPFPFQAAEQQELRERYGAQALHTWVTEAGAFSESTPVVDLTYSQQVDQARYLVQSTVQDLASGTDRHMWFIAPPCCTFFGVYFSLLTRDFQPMASYSAFAAMTSLLGRANYVRDLPGLPQGTFGFQFKSGGRAISVVWAEKPTLVNVPVTAATASLYGTMGVEQEPPTVVDGAVSVTASLDPLYVVSDGAGGLAAKPSASEAHKHSPLTPARHIVLAQRYDAANAPPEKDFEAAAPYGYALDPETAMGLDVYNFNDTAKTVTVTGHTFGDWSLGNPRRVAVRVPANGRASVPFTLLAGKGIEGGVDYPLVFEATLGGARVTPSVSRIQLATDGEPGEQIALAPTVEIAAPLDGATIAGSKIAIKATVADLLSGVDPARVEVRVDGALVAHAYNRKTGKVRAAAAVPPGRHRVWVRAYNKAFAPSAAEAFLVTTGVP